jgi:hypothetical protein
VICGIGNDFHSRKSPQYIVCEKDPNSTTYWGCIHKNQINKGEVMKKLMFLFAVVAVISICFSSYTEDGQIYVEVFGL